MASAQNFFVWLEKIRIEALQVDALWSTKRRACIPWLERAEIRWKIAYTSRTLPYKNINFRCGHSLTPRKEQKQKILLVQGHKK